MILRRLFITDSLVSSCDGASKSMMSRTSAMVDVNSFTLEHFKHMLLITKTFLKLKTPIIHIEQEQTVLVDDPFALFIRRTFGKEESNPSTQQTLTSQLKQIVY